MNNKLKFIILAIVTTFVLWLGIAIGSSNIGLLDIISIIGHKLFNLPLSEGISPSDVVIIWTLRLPRVLLAFLVGGALSASGGVIQSILKNPLASPYTLGVSSGASLGAGLVIVLGISIPFLGSFTLPVVGFVFGLATVFGILQFAKQVDKSLSNMTIILTGMVFSLFFNAILTIITALAGDSMKDLTLWQMGSFSMRGWSYLSMFLPFFIVGIFGMFIYTKEMDILTFGEDQARTLGVNTSKVKTRLFIFSAILTGASVSITGTIGFIDLIAPHIVRKIFGSKHHLVIPISIIVGGSMMVITDLVARTLLSPSELPVGAITAILGAPFFAYIYFKKSR